MKIPLVSETQDTPHITKHGVPSTNLFPAMAGCKRSPLPGRREEAVLQERERERARTPPRGRLDPWAYKQE